ERQFHHAHRRIRDCSRSASLSVSFIVGHVAESQAVERIWHDRETLQAPEGVLRGGTAAVGNEEPRIAVNRLPRRHAEELHHDLDASPRRLTSPLPFLS